MNIKKLVLLFSFAAMSSLLVEDMFAGGTSTRSRKPQQGRNRKGKSGARNARGRQQAGRSGRGRRSAGRGAAYVAPAVVGAAVMAPAVLPTQAEVAEVERVAVLGHILTAEDLNNIGDEGYLGYETTYSDEDKAVALDKLKDAISATDTAMNALASYDAATSSIYWKSVVTLWNSTEALWKNYRPFSRRAVSVAERAEKHLRYDRATKMINISSLTAKLAELLQKPAPTKDAALEKHNAKIAEHFDALIMAWNALPAGSANDESEPVADPMIQDIADNGAAIITALRDALGVAVVSHEAEEAAELE